MVGRFSSRESIYREPRSGRARWIVPLVTFMLGALLAGVGVGLVMRGDDAPAVTAAPSPTPTTTTESEQVAVPRACLNIADGAQDLQVLLDQAMAAARDLDAARLSRLVRRIDTQQTALRDDTEVCQRGVATATAVPTQHTVTSTVTSTPSATSAPASTARPRSTASGTSTARATPRATTPAPRGTSG